MAEERGEGREPPYGMPDGVKAGRHGRRGQHRDVPGFGLLPSEQDLSEFGDGGIPETIAEARRLGITIKREGGHEREKANPGR